MSDTPFTLFYAWQSDTPSVTGRNFVEDAATKALKRIDASGVLGLAPRLDKDTKDVSGTPDIANTILDKIRTSSAILADLSFIGKGSLRPKSEPKLLPNPNVLLELGYADDNCVLMHGPCHQKWHADHPEEIERPGPVSDPSPCLTRLSKRHDKKPFIYWWDIPSKLAEKLDGRYEEVEFECKDTHERCTVSVNELLPFLTPERQTSRGDGNWGIKVLKDRPDELAFEPPTGSDDWLYMPVTWLEEENED